jgi:erythromycin esterase
MLPNRSGIGCLNLPRRRRIVMRAASILTFFLLLVPGTGHGVAQSPPGAVQPDTTEAVVAWLRQTAIPLRHVEAGNDFADLEPLREILRDVRVVALGESTHGTKEFFQVKHRLLEFLVREMGFTAFAIEASFSNTQPINDYVLYGLGDRATVLTGQGWIVWDMEEFAAMLDWIRSYNMTVPDERKVRFHGVDVYWNEVGQQQVLDYLRRVAPEQVAGTDSLFQVIAREEAKRPVQDTLALAAALPRLQRLEDYLLGRRVELSAPGSASGFDKILQHVRAMRAAITPGSRSLGMADNLRFIIEHERPGTKFVLSAFNSHVAKTGTLGQALRPVLGDEYFAVGLAFAEGSFHTRVMPAGEPAGDLRAVAVPPVPERSLPWYLSRSGMGNLFLNLRSQPASPLVRGWLEGRLGGFYSGWAFSEPAPQYGAVVYPQLYDGLLFIQRTTPATPTENARRNVGNRIRI